MTKIRLGNKDIYYQVFYKNIKHMYLRVKDKTIIITCPRHTKESKIETFIRQSESKILKRYLQNEQKISLYSKTEFNYFGQKLQLDCRYDCTENRYQLNQTSMTIDFKKASFDAAYVETIYLRETLKKVEELRVQIAEELQPFTQTENIVFKTQLMKSRYGSCMPKKGIIKINSLLARFDLRYLKSVLIHELLHLTIPNHQKDFYRAIETYIPDYRKMMRDLHHLTRKYVF